MSYIPDAFREERPEILRAFIAAHPLGTLITMTSEEGLGADLIPMLWAAGEEGSPHGVLEGHVARANPLWRALPTDAPVLVVFGGANRYISPSWYPSKREHGRVVPTWNYAMVQARGRICFRPDAAKSQTLEHLGSLSAREEQRVGRSWRISDAPAEFIEKLVEGIVPFAITLSGLIGKFKASQNRSAPDRMGVDAGLRELEVPDEVIRELVREPYSAS